MTEMSALAWLIVAAAIGGAFLFAGAVVWLLDTAPMVAMFLFYGPIIGFMAWIAHSLILAQLTAT